MVKATEKTVKKIAYIPMNTNQDEYIINTGGSDVEEVGLNNDCEGFVGNRLLDKVKNDQKHIKLDLSFIISNIIVCSYPICFSKQNVLNNKFLIYKKFYRNSLTDLVEYLDEKVGRNHWKIFNAKAEFNHYEDYSDDDLFRLLNKSYDNLHNESSTTELLSMILSGDVKDSLTSKNIKEVDTNRNDEDINHDNLPLNRCGWLDHCPPPLSHFINIIELLDKFIMEDSNNAAVIHCKMGKGRSGCLVVGYLLKHHHMTLQSALDVFKTTRFNYGLITGVTIKSQLRYLKYYYHLIENKIPYAGNATKECFIKSIVINKPGPSTFQWLSDIVKDSESSHYYEVKLETYGLDMKNLVLIDKFVIKNTINDNHFALFKPSILVKNEDIRITISLKFDDTSNLSTMGTRLLEKSFDLSAIYWINLKAESIINKTKHVKLVMPFQECDNLSDRVGLLNQSVNLIQLFKSFEIEYTC